MFDPNKIEDLQYSTEKQIMDRKSARIKAVDLAIPIVAMANADGGYLAIGIEDDGTITGTDIQIKMFDDHYTVESPGILPGLVRVNNIREFHFSRNPKIVELLNEYDLVKEFGEGVDRVYRDMAAAGLPEPEYKQSEFMLYATLKNKNWGKEDANWNEDNHRLFGKGDEKAIKKDRIIMRAEAALRIIEDNPIITVNELASALNVTRKQAENALKLLKEDGRIHREGSARKGRWIID